MKKGSIAIPLGVALISSFMYGVWNILSYNLVRILPGNILLSLFLMMGFSAVLSFFYLIAASKRNRKSMAIEFMKYPMAGGCLFGLGNIIFFSMIRVNVLPIVAAIVYSNIIIFSFLLIKSKGSHISFRYILGTVIAVLGLAIIELLNAGKIVIDLLLIEQSILLVILYGFGSYFIYKSSLSKEKAGNSIFMIFLAETAVIGAIALVFNGFRGLTDISGIYAFEVIITGAVLTLAVVLEFKSFYIIGQYRAKFINIINIFLNFETIWVLVFSVIFLSVSSFGIIVGVVIASFGIWIVSVS
ncbi:MAG: hypothetical protein M1477_03950 [Candidatus Thermoplasmatota archaeon]|nr:hypothetical protein [Candidatus Thermoplasmatota archaeon]MCL5989085.1 hypothetical protein [Candidatus Thermoplasmatota archaeon]